MDCEYNKGTLGSMQVSLRIRPLFLQEIERECYVSIEVLRGETQVQIKNLAFTYNYVFPQHITQQEFYDTAVKSLVGKLFQGYNVSILAYGETGSGKTYTNVTNKHTAHLLICECYGPYTSIKNPYPPYFSIHLYSQM